MPILSAGVSYRRAPVELLERLAFPTEEFGKAYHHLTSLEGVHGGVIISTCNRVEVVAEVESYHAGFQTLRGFISESREIPVEELGEPLVSRYEDDAIRHFFQVTSGIDSMVVGEPQILAQVRAASKRSHDEGAATPLLGALIRRAVRTGRRARAETGIGANPAAMVEAGAELARQTLGSLGGRRLLVVGAGTMAELAVRSLGARGVGEVVVLNRSPSRAERLALRTGAVAGSLADLTRALAGADLAVTVTGATGLVVEPEPVRRALAERKDRPMFILDLAVPRDVDPEIGTFAGVTLVDIDDLRAVVAGASDDDLARVREIVEEEVGRFAEWRRAARLAPVIQALYDRAEHVRRAELDRVQARLASLSREERAAVEAATEAIVKKLLHGPVVRVKELTEDDAELRLLARMFGLEPPHAQ
jgi:glutamyl-tRNA reductase